MAFLMSDVAAGSTAARTLQQNMYAGQYDKANIDAAAQETQLKVQQEQANVEKTRLANLVTESEYKASENSKSKLKALVETPDFKAADDVKRLQMMTSVATQTADIEGVSKLIQATANAEFKKAQTELKTHEKNRETFGNALATIRGASDTQIPELVSKMPEEMKAAIKSQIPGFFEQTDPKLQKAQLEALVANGANKNDMATNEQRLKVLQLQVERANEQLKIHQQILTNKQAKGGTNEELKEYNAYNRATYRIDAEYKTPVKQATDAFKKAVEEDNKKTGLFSLFTGGSSAIEDAAGKEDKQKELKSTKAWQALQELRKEAIEKKLGAVEGLPEGTEKNRLFKLLNEELEGTKQALPPTEKPKSKTPEPAAKTETKPAATVPSNKPAAPKFEEGKIYSDAKGNKAKYVNGKWEPQ